MTLIPDSVDSLVRTNPPHTSLSLFNASALIRGMQAILTSKATNKLHLPAPVFDELSHPYQVMITHFSVFCRKPVGTASTADLFGEGFELRDDAVEFVDERVCARLAEDIHQRAVVPERAVLAAGEAVEDGIAFDAIVGENFAGVGKFVGGGNEADIFRFMRDLFDVGALSFAPIPFFAGDFVRIRAAVDDARDTIAEFFTDFIEAREAALVLDGVMQKRRDDFIFSAAVLNDDGRDAKQVADVRLAFAFAALVEMQLCRVTKRLHETICEDRLYDCRFPVSHQLAPPPIPFLIAECISEERV